MLAAAASQNPVRRNAKMKKNTLSPKSIIAILIAAIIAAVIVVLGVGAALVYMLVLNTPSKQFLMAQAKMLKTEWSGKTTVADVLIIHIIPYIQNAEHTGKEEYGEAQHKIPDIEQSIQSSAAVCPTAYDRL